MLVRWPFLTFPKRLVNFSIVWKSVLSSLCLNGLFNEVPVLKDHGFFARPGMNITPVCDDKIYKQFQKFQIFIGNFQFFDLNSC